MARTAGDLITDARDVTNDADPNGYRIDDPTFIRYVRDGIREMVGLIPGVFATVGEIPCVSGQTLQQAPDTSVHLVSIIRVKDGNAITATDKNTLDNFYPGWHAATPAPADNYMRHPADPNKFFITPPAPVGQVLIGEYAEVPTLPSAITDNLPAQIQETRYTALLYYIVARAESKDDEHVNSGRAKLMYGLFQATVLGQEQIVRQLITMLEKIGGDARLV